ncbi:hypothetical protein ACFV03_51100 [Streptomyces mirabilis]
MTDQGTEELLRMFGLLATRPTRSAGNHCPDLEGAADRQGTTP